MDIIIYLHYQAHKAKELRAQSHVVFANRVMLDLDLFELPRPRVDDVTWQSTNEVRVIWPGVECEREASLPEYCLRRALTFSVQHSIGNTIQRKMKNSSGPLAMEAKSRAQM
jgi:hypothetical protein